jgi:hypothetical protein
MERRFPNLLVATEFSPNASGGGPAVVRQLLADWPPERLHWWSCLPEVDRRFGQNVASHRVATIPGKLYPQRRWTRVKAALLTRLWAPWASGHLRTALNQVRPEAIWAIPHNWSAFPLAGALPFAECGYHVSIHDFVDAHGMAERIGARRCRALVQAVDRLYTDAQSRDVIADSMVEEMSQRTGQHEAAIRRAGVQPTDFDFLESKRSQPASKIRIAYAGSILVEREFALFVQALATARNRVPRPIELHLFGAHRFSTNAWFDPTWMKERGNLPEAELLRALRACDWGFSPMDLADSNPRYNRFSFPTKFITYLAAGLPIITLGHPESTVMKMAMKYRVGICAQSRDERALVTDLESALADADPWQTYGYEIVRCARAEFDGAKMRATLNDCLVQCSQTAFKR